MSDSDPDEQAALARLRGASEVLVREVVRALPGWARARAAILGEAWGGWAPARLEAVCREAGKAGERAAARVGEELTALFSLDPADQRATPLEVVRGAVAEPTAVLADAGLPAVVRDSLAERWWPGDPYDLSPRTFADIDGDLAAVHFAWGLAKARVHKARRPAAAPD
ncbi:MAG: hypothetical protein ACRDY7_14610 [Acidimicrobiia bacterium]